LSATSIFDSHQMILPLRWLNNFKAAQAIHEAALWVRCYIEIPDKERYRATSITQPFPSGLGKEVIVSSGTRHRSAKRSFDCVCRHYDLTLYRNPTAGFERASRKAEGFGIAATEPIQSEDLS
jgi:hypothetical protein